jgi:hypothetical protein
VTPVDGFTIAPERRLGDDAAPSSRLFHHGRDTGRRLAGAILEASLRVEGGWLFFLTHDVPFEETLEIYLLDAGYALLDRAGVAMPYAAGLFGDLQVLSDRRLRFRFLGEARWHLELLKKPQLRLPLIGEPRGVSRRFGFRRRFSLSRESAG